MEKKYEQDNHRLCQAIIYATEQHTGQFRKGTTRPYIIHPLETMQILLSMGADTDLLAAGVLHDTLEDTAATAADIRQRFGDAVADLVCAHTEDKSKTWQERKRHAIASLKAADKRLKMLVMADKVSNLRSMAADLSEIGEALWDRFNAPASQQAWYYSAIQDALYDMQTDPRCASVYWEMVALYKDIFVSYYLSDSEYTLYQFCRDGSCFFLSKGDPEWKPSEFPPPDSAMPIPRLQAEALEDRWNERFWNYQIEDFKKSPVS